MQISAIHEAGHVVMAYLAGFTSNKIAILNDGSGDGYSALDYGGGMITPLIASMINFLEDPSFYFDLPESIRANTEPVAFKISGVILAGPVAEAYFRSGIDFQGELEIDLRGPDLISVQNIDALLQRVSVNHPTGYIGHQLSGISQLMRDPIFWNAVQQLGNDVITSTSASLDKAEIEASLTSSGFMEYLANAKQ